MSSTHSVWDEAMEPPRFTLKERDRMTEILLECEGKVQRHQGHVSFGTTGCWAHRPVKNVKAYRASHARYLATLIRDAE